VCHSASGARADEFLNPARTRVPVVSVFLEGIAECRQRSADPLPRKQMVGSFEAKKAGRLAQASLVYMRPGAGNGTRTHDPLLGKQMHNQRGARPSNAWSGGRDSNPRHPAELGTDGHSHLPEVLAADEHSRVGASAYLL